MKRAVRDVLVPATTQLPAVQSRAAAGCRRSRSAYPASPPVQADGSGANPSRGTGSRTSRFAPRKAPPGCTRVLGGAGTCCSCRAPRPVPHSAPPGRASCPWLVNVVEGCAGARDGFALVSPTAFPRRSRVREGRSPGHDLPASAWRSQRGPHGQQFTEGNAVRTLNPRQVRAPARGGRARRSGFRFRHDGGARAGERDRPDVAQRASRLPDDPGCPRRGRTRSDLHPVEELMTRSTRDQVLRSRLTISPSTHASPAEQKPPGNRHRDPQGGTMHAAWGRPAHRDGDPQHSHQRQAQ